MVIQFTEREGKAFQKISEAAAQLGLPCYLVGGFVRDKLLDRPTVDADFVCVGDALNWLEAAAAHINPQPKLSVFKNFGTAHFKLPDGFDLEFVGARKESYRAHSRKPDVVPGTIEDDQKRRDFTINALGRLV